MSHNKIGNEGAKALASGNLGNLVSLKLSGNQIGDEGAEALANGNLGNLTWLSFGAACLVGDKGKRAFAEALNAGKFPELTKLFFSSEMIDPYCNYTEELSDALKRNIDRDEKASKSKLPVIIACTGLLLGLSIAYFAGAIALAPILAITVCLAAAAIGALVGYAVGKFCNKVIEEKENNPGISICDAVKSLFSDTSTAKHNARDYICSNYL